eukprot:NODE_549_length_878_cov_339.148372_g208_i6.p2 GENE.NODE_549_length_878_cov_339.148372_g208_i6~~NODE_549_length_878_cov_339.148372_g208_i6.p2  ORF type:complete len:61 (+),score=1.79 NODE_549_length_878_cov_339.148372_g208_i6:550-732(+)
MPSSSFRVPELTLAFLVLCTAAERPLGRKGGFPKSSHFTFDFRAFFAILAISVIFSVPSQ